ncbi:hypothetical protein OMK64_19610, partial [Cellulomonas fimi]|uniref:hypothetical protein n=1 Tax=Cellulomonas fimi TaxID=1708 RepID=UPI00234D09C4
MTFPEQAPRRRDLRRRDRGRPRRRRRLVVEILVVATGLATAAVAAPLVLTPDRADGVAAAPAAGLEQRRDGMWTGAYVTLLLVVPAAYSAVLVP